MSRQVLLCLETNSRARTDYTYVKATIGRFYRDNRKVIYKPIFLESKTKYNDSKKVKEINGMIKEYPGETTVIYFIDTDDYNTSAETKTLYDCIEKYCKDKGYELVFFSRDIEDVFWGKQVQKGEKVRIASEFVRKKSIENVSEKRLCSNTKKRHYSNILNVLDQFWERKEK